MTTLHTPLSVWERKTTLVRIRAVNKIHPGGADVTWQQAHLRQSRSLFATRDFLVGAEAHVSWYRFSDISAAKQ